MIHDPQRTSDARPRHPTGFFPSFRLSQGRSEQRRKKKTRTNFPKGRFCCYCHSFPAMIAPQRDSPSNSGLLRPRIRRAVAAFTKHGEHVSRPLPPVCMAARTRRPATSNIHTINFTVTNCVSFICYLAAMCLHFIPFSLRESSPMTAETGGLKPK